MAVEGLGRVFNVALIASGAAISLRDAQGVTFVVSGVDSGVVITSSATFGGTYATPGNIITRKQTNTSTSGTAKWVEGTITASNTVVCAAGSTAFYVDANDLPAGNEYVKATAGSTGLITAIVHDLQVQRDAANLAALSA
jgi:hypothetical protein